MGVANVTQGQASQWHYTGAGSTAAFAKDSKPVELRIYDKVSELETDWLCLERTSKCSPFQKLSWIKPLYSHISNPSFDSSITSKEPFVVSGYVENAIVFILPLVLEVDVFGKRLKWVGDDVSDYNGPILQKEFAKTLPADFVRQIVGCIRKQVPDLDAIYLTRNPGSQHVLDMSTEELAISWQAEHSSHTLKLKRDWSASFARLRSKKTRQRLRSKFRSFGETGSISFRQIRGLEKRLDATRQILDWKTDHLKHSGRRNPFGHTSTPSETRQTIMASVEDTSNTSIKVFGLFRDDELVAGMLAFIDEKRFYYLVSAYAPEIPGKYSIGTQLLVKTLEFASRTGLQKYDFLIGDESYKLDWCDASVPLFNHFIPFTSKGRIFGAGLQVHHELKKRIVQSPALSRITRHLIRAGSGETQYSSRALSFLNSEANVHAGQRKKQPNKSHTKNKPASKEHA